MAERDKGLSKKKKKLDSLYGIVGNNLALKALVMRLTSDISIDKKQYEDKLL